RQRVEPTGFLGKHGGGRLRLGAHDGKVHLGVRVVSRQINACERDQASAGYIDLALYEAGQILLDLVCQPRVAARVGLGFMTTHNLQCPGDLFDFEELKLIADFDVVVAPEGNTAIKARLDL